MSQEPSNQIQTALERLASTEELDQRLVVVRTKNWLALVTIFGLILALLIWSFYGSIAVTVKGTAIYLDSEQIYGIIPLKEGQKIRKGNPSLVQFLGISQQKFGSLKGEVSEVSLLPVAQEEILPKELLPFYKIDPKPAILVKIAPKKVETPSGFTWTSEKGPPFAIEKGSLGEVTIHVETIKPIYYIFPLHEP